MEIAIDTLYITDKFSLDFLNLKIGGGFYYFIQKLPKDILRDIIKELVEKKAKVRLLSKIYEFKDIPIEREITGKQIGFIIYDQKKDYGYLILPI